MRHGGGEGGGGGVLSKIYLKRGWNRKEGRGHKNFKNRGASWVRSGCLKKGEGLEPPYKLWIMEEKS